MNDASYNMISTLAIDAPVPGSRNQLAYKVEAIYDDCYHDLLRYLMLTGCDGTDANDFLQEAFLRMVQQLKQGKSIKTPKFWLLRVLRNIRCDEHNYTSRFLAVDADDLELIVNRRAGEHPNPEVAALTRERYERVRTAMASLTERQYQCILLRASGLKLREIAEVVGISVVTVAEACGRAMEKLGRLQYE